MTRSTSFSHLATLGLIFTVFAIAGCATSPRTAHQFEPAPMARVATREPAEQAPPRPTTDLLRDAQREFESANQSQEQGDRDAALKHYTRMLELLAEANLDPAVFYNLRSEFQRILENTDRQASLKAHERGRHRELSGVEGLIEPSERVFGDLEIEFPLSERVLAEIDEIQQLYPKNFQWGMNRSGKYLPFIHAELAKAGLPLDLAWLAMVESQFSPKVVSRAGAGGMWQFMRTTARRYGMRMDEYVDERFDWQASTRTAIRFLQDLHGRFNGQWPLAITAYNMGEGGVERTIAAVGGETDLWRLLDTPAVDGLMQEETRKFYPKFLASIIVAANPERFGFEASSEPLEKTVSIPVRGSYSLAALDRAADLPEGTLAQLNPHLVRGVTPPTGEFNLAAPPEASNRVLTALHRIPKARTEIYAAGSVSGRRTHTVKRGETLSGIADQYKVPVADLMKANRLRTAHHLVPGRRLTIPGTTEDRDEPDPAPESTTESNTKDTKTASAPARAPRTPSRTYTVKKGDTLSDIAKANKVSITDIMKWNNKDNPRIAVGDKLVLSPLEEISEAAVAALEPETTHVVRSGECPDKIAKLYGVKLDNLLQWNNLTAKSTVRVGDKLVVRGCEQKAAEMAKDGRSAKTEDTGKGAAAGKSTEAAAKSGSGAATREVVHTVAKGESPSSIAQKYGVSTRDLLAWNQMTPKSVIKVGDRCVVRVPGSAPEAAQKTAAGKETTPAKETAKTAAGKETTPAKDTAKTAKGQKVTHTVAQGENPTVIARKYGVKLDDLRSWNGWAKDTVIKVGDKVTVYKP